MTSLLWAPLSLGLQEREADGGAEQCPPPHSILQRAREVPQCSSAPSLLQSSAFSRCSSETPSQQQI